MSNEVPISIRFKDIDMHQHVNNAVYFTYMENARAEVLMEGFLDFFSKGILLIVAEATCKYKHPIKLNDKIVCELQLERTGASHFTITYLFKEAVTHGLYAEGKTKMVVVNEQTNRPIRIPEEFSVKYLK